MKAKLYLSLSAGVLLLVTLLGGGKSFAAVKTWTGGGADTNFSTVGNWTGGVLPVNGDILAFPQPPVVGQSRSQSATNDIALLTSIAGITIDQGTGAAGYTGLTLGNITITGTITLGNAQDLSLNGASTITAGTGGFSIVLGDKDSDATLNNTVALGGETLVLSCTTCAAKDTASVDVDRITGTSLSKVTASRVDFRIAPATADAAYPGSLEMTNSIFEVGGGSLAPFGASSMPLKLTNSQLQVSMTPSVNMTVPKPLIISGNLFGVANGSADLTYTDAAIYPYQTNGEILEFSGAVTLLTDIVVEPFHGSMKFSGALNGNYLIAAANIHNEIDRLIIAASPNTTKIPNGNYVFVTNATLADAAPTIDVLAVTGGTVIINGTRGRVIVSPGSTLGGSGTVGAVNLLGTLAPGNSPGCINTGDLTMTNSATFNVQLEGNTVCTQYDQTKVTGAVTLGDAALSVSMLAGFKPASGKVFTIIDNDGADAVTGTFAGLVEGATVTSNGVTYKVSYIGGTGNDVTMTVLGTAPDTGAKILGVGSVYVGIFAITVAFTAAAYLSRSTKARK